MPPGLGVASPDQRRQAALSGTTSQPHPALPRSPPRPSPGSLHYSDEDVTKYNDLIQAESSSLTEKPSEVSDSQVRGEGPGALSGCGAAPFQSAGLHRGPARRPITQTASPPSLYGP